MAAKFVFEGVISLYLIIFNLTSSTESTLFLFLLSSALPSPVRYPDCL